MFIAKSPHTYDTLRWYLQHKITSLQQEKQGCLQFTTLTLGNELTQTFLSQAIGWVSVDFSCFLIFNWEYFAPKGVPFKKYEFSERQEEKDRKRVSE